MILLVDVVVEGRERPPPGSTIHIHVRDTSQADAEAPLVVERVAEVTGERSHRIGSAEVEIPDRELDPRRRLEVFAHVDVDGDGKLTAGDFITTQAYPVPQDSAGGEARLELAVVRI